MKLLRHASLATTATVALASLGIGRVAAEDAVPSDVLDLNKDNFTPSVATEPLMLVEFFAPWCGHCKQLAPQYEVAATELKADGIKLAKVDCTAQDELCSLHEVRGFPTMKVFRNGVPKEYNGPRKSDGIVSYMRKQALPAVSKVDASNISDFKTKDNIVVVAYLGDSDKKELDTYTVLADAMRETHLFGHTSDPEAAKAAGVSAPALVIYRKFDEPEVKYDGKFSDENALESFIKEQSIPLIDEVGPDNFMTYAEANLPLAYFFVEPEYAQKNAIIEELKPLAKANKGKLNFVWIDAVKFVNHAKGLNLAGEKWPSFAIQDLQDSTKFPLDDLGSDPAKAIKDFVEKFQKGSLKPSIKSEPVPAEQDGPVFVVVADEFDKVVLDDKKDVLVEFYAPWCGHCKKLAPTYDSLGELYATHKDKVTIAKMDATANDVPPSAGFSVASFPTIKFKPAGSKEFLDYEGDRTLDAFVDYIANNGKNKVEVKLPPANETDAKEAAKPAADAEAPRHEEL